MPDFYNNQGAADEVQEINDNMLGVHSVPVVNPDGSWVTQSGLNYQTSSVQAFMAAATSGGWTPSSQVALSNSPQNIKSVGAGQLGGLDISNTTSGWVFIQFFNAVAANVTIGVTIPAFVKAIPPTAAANINWGAGIAFNTAISWAATNSPTGSGAPLSPVTGYALYK